MVPRPRGVVPAPDFRQVALRGQSDALGTEGWRVASHPPDAAAARSCWQLEFWAVPLGVPLCGSWCGAAEPGKGPDPSVPFLPHKSSSKEF